MTRDRNRVLLSYNVIPVHDEKVVRVNFKIYDVSEFPADKCTQYAAREKRSAGHFMLLYSAQQ